MRDEVYSKIQEYPAFGHSNYFGACIKSLAMKIVTGPVECTADSTTFSSVDNYCRMMDWS